MNHKKTMQNVPFELKYRPYISKICSFFWYCVPLFKFLVCTEVDCPIYCRQFSLKTSTLVRISYNSASTSEFLDSLFILASSFCPHVLNCLFFFKKAEAEYIFVLRVISTLLFCFLPVTSMGSSRFYLFSLL